MERSRVVNHLRYMLRYVQEIFKNGDLGHCRFSVIAVGQRWRTNSALRETTWRTVRFFRNPNKRTLNGKICVYLEPYLDFVTRYLITTVARMGFFPIEDTRRSKMVNMLFDATVAGRYRQISNITNLSLG